MPRDFSFTWIEPGKLGACSAPAFERDLAELRQKRIALVINLREGRHRDEQLARYGMRQLHLPVRDFTTPAPEQIAEALSAIEAAHVLDEAAIIHCVAGLGRTGTVVACYLVSQGMEAPDAIARVRQLRPGSIETPEQEQAVAKYSARRA